MGQQMPVPRGGTPAVVRAAGALVAAEGAVCMAEAVRVTGHMMARTGSGHAGNYVGAALVLGLAGAVLFSGIELIRGRWWPRTVATITQILLLGLAGSALTTNDPGVGIPLGLLALTVLGLLFSPPSNRWMATPFDLSPAAWNSDSRR